MSLTTARYGGGMMEPAETTAAETEEGAMRASLARGDAMLGAVAPVLRHLLVHDDNGMLSEEIVARVRGMIADLATTLLDRLAVPDGSEHRLKHPEAEISALIAALAADAALLGHVHALALEWQLTERLQARMAIDPVLSPLLQALLGSPDPATASLAMHALAAQARFGQSQRRMQLPPGELPADLLHAALLALRAQAATRADGERRASAAEAAIRAEYDESRSRIALLSRLVTGLGQGAVAALTVGHAGVAIFLTALADASGQDRDQTVLATGEGQVARLALALRAAGLKPEAISGQLFALHPDAPPPPGFERIAPDQAAALIGRAGQ